MNHCEQGVKRKALLWFGEESGEFGDLEFLIRGKGLIFMTYVEDKNASVDNY